MTSFAERSCFFLRGRVAVFLVGLHSNTSRWIRVPPREVKHSFFLFIFCLFFYLLNCWIATLIRGVHVLTVHRVTHISLSHITIALSPHTIALSPHTIALSPHTIALSPYRTITVALSHVLALICTNPLNNNDSLCSCHLGWPWRQQAKGITFLRAIVTLLREYSQVEYIWQVCFLLKNKCKLFLTRGLTSTFCRG